MGQVMRCDQARQLFDAYLDGELSASLATELGAHRLRCAECRQALALLEVSGHIVRTDREPVQLEQNFTERLLGCMDQRSLPWLMRWRREMYIAGTLAAAAVIALAFLGLFDNRESKVAGIKEVGIQRTQEQTPTAPPKANEIVPTDEAGATDRTQETLEAWIDRARDSIAIKRESGASLRELLDQTATQWGHILEDASSQPVSPIALPATDTDSGDAPAGSDDVDPDVDGDADG